jgi:hypothetical protein
VKMVFYEIDGFVLSRYLSHFKTIRITYVFNICICSLLFRINYSRRNIGVCKELTEKSIPVASVSYGLCVAPGSEKCVSVDRKTKTTNGWVKPGQAGSTYINIRSLLRFP